MMTRCLAGSNYGDVEGITSSPWSQGSCNGAGHINTHRCLCTQIGNLAIQINTLMLILSGVV